MMGFMCALAFAVCAVALISGFSAPLNSGGDGVFPSKCSLYLVPSTIPGAGRGVVAGQNYTPGDTLGIVPSISQPIRTVEITQLKNYVFGSGHNDFAMVMFGPWNLCNHGNPQTVVRYWADDEVTEPDPTNSDAPYAVFRSTEYGVHTKAFEGEEMFETYGDNWFDRFAATTAPRSFGLPQRMDINDLITYGHCLTDVRVQQSTIKGAGKGPFAARDFAAGEVVTISPTLVLPRHAVDDSATDSVLMNYCYSRPDSDLALFPLNYGLLINHQRGDAANIELDWYDWGPAMNAVAAKYHQGRSSSDSGDAVHGLSLDGNLQLTAQDLWSADFAPLDLAYRAKRPIKQGEELFLDYGEAWQAAWDNYASVSTAAASTAGAADGAAKPSQRFRSYIELPEALHQPQWTKQPDTHCERFLIPSTIPGAGRGVVAGRGYSNEEWIEEAVTIVVSTYASDHSQLTNYVFGSGHEDYALIIYGPGNIYNHRKPHTLGRYGNDEDMRDPSSQPYPYTDSTVVLYKTLADIGAGDEMYETYGDHWFNRFRAKQPQEGKEAQAPRAVAQAMVAAQRMANEDMIQHGICLSYTAVHRSTLPDAGRGLFAARDFAPGEVVTVSPVLSLPKHVTDLSLNDNTVLMNYCIADPDSDLVLFPLNYGPLINHQRGDAVNIELDWYDWGPAVRALSAKYHNNTAGEPTVQDLTLADKLGQSVKQLYTANFAQLDLAYRATRAIPKGTELFLDYGEAWQTAWDAYQVELQTWLAAKAAEGIGAEGIGAEEALASTDETKPLFRAYMAAPEGLFQPHWKTSAASADRGEL